MSIPGLPTMGRRRLSEVLERPPVTDDNSTSSSTGFTWARDLDATSHMYVIT